MFRRRSPTTRQADRLLVLLGCVLDVEDLDIPFPLGQGVRDIQKLLLPVKLELMEGPGSGLSAKAVELLPMNAEDVAHVAAPSQRGAEHIVEVGEAHPVVDGDDPNDHRTDLTKRSTQDKALGRRRFDHRTWLSSAQSTLFLSQ